MGGVVPQRAPNPSEFAPTCTKGPKRPKQTCTNSRSEALVCKLRTGTNLHEFAQRRTYSQRGVQIRVGLEPADVLQYEWEAYCRVSLSSKLRSQEITAIQMGGGVLPYKLEVYCRTFWTNCRGWGFPNIAQKSSFLAGSSTNPCPI